MPFLRSGPLLRLKVLEEHVRSVAVGLRVAFSTVIRVLRTLDLTSQLEALVPDPQLSPVEIVKRKGTGERQRARPQTTPPKTAASSIWGDQQ